MNKTKHTSRLLTIVTTFVAFLLCICYVFAIEITEVSYDLEGSDSLAPGEWIEIYNDTTSQVEISKIKFFEGGSYHNINEYGSSGIVIPPLSYAVIAHRADLFLDFFTSFSGIVFDSSFSLSNTGETLQITDDNQVELDSFTYTSSDGAFGDGNTLQKNEALIVSSQPTPGFAYTYIESQQDTTEESSTSTSGSSQKVTRTYDIVIEGDFFSGVRNKFFVKEKIGERTNIPTAFWNFGDTSVAKGREVYHAYSEEGTYHITASDIKTEEVFATLVVVITKPNIKITKEGEAYKLTNLSDSSINISKWSVRDQAKTLFSFPQHTILLRSQSITIPIDTDQLLLYLQNEFGVTVLENNLQIEEKKAQETPKDVTKKSTEPKEIKKTKQNTENIAEKENFKKENNTTEKEKNNFFSIKDKQINLTVTKENFWMWVLGLILVSFLIISPLFFEIYRSNKNKKQK